MALLLPWNASAQRLNRKKAAIGGRTMPFHVQLFGSRPADGYSLYISLHGGGNAPKELNDQQWDNQKRLYRPDHAVYIAPRAPYDDWDMWFKPGLDDFYRALIQMAVAFEGVNPDKVYIMGYSAGGDGVWRMAPREPAQHALHDMVRRTRQRLQPQRGRPTARTADGLASTVRSPGLCA